jgi:hypothetical protein
VLAAGVSVERWRVRVVTPFGDATFDTLRPRRLVAEFGRWDGTRSEESLRRSSYFGGKDFDEVIAALDRIGAIIDSSAAWRYGRRYTENPGAPTAETSAEFAYRMERWVPQIAPQRARSGPSCGPLAELAAHRRSVDLASSGVRPDAAGLGAYEACMAASDPIGKPIASAGDLRSIHLFLVGAPDAMGLRPLLAFADQGSVELDQIDGAGLADAFVPDPGLFAALADGASVILIAADPLREAKKYGDRGWQYCQFEAGAFAHHLSLALVEADCAHRIVGGFYERRLSRLIPAGAARLEPLITLVVTGASAR